MKIAIDFREAARPNRAGKGEYTFQLVRALIALATNDQIILLIEPSQAVSLPAGNWTIKTVPVAGPLWHLWVVGWLEFCRPVKLYFSPTSVIVPALVRSVKVVTTLHDFTVWRFPTKHLPKAVLIEHWLMALALRASNHLIAVSEFTRQETIALFHTPASKLSVTLEAKDDRFVLATPNANAVTALRSKYNLPEKFILSLGTIEPRKNIVRLIDAYQSAVGADAETKLVLAGGKGWFADQLLNRAGPNVILAGYIEDIDRPLLYSLAIGFVFPSLYEGFGIPPLEAMACGIPVIASQVASLPEVVGDAAILVNPHDTQALAAAISRLLDSETLRADLRQKGLVQAAKFTWATTALSTNQVFHTYD